VVDVLLEREDELARLADLLAATPSAGGRVVLVRGEPGIGKTTLLRAALRHAAETGPTFVGTCDDLATPQPWAPLWDVARDRPGLAAALRAGDPRRVMEATLDLLGDPEAPSVLAIEDAHWADDATVDVITFVARRIEHTAALLLLTYRDGEVDDGHSLQRMLGALPPGSVERIRPSPLSLDAIRAMAGGGGVDAEDVLALTGGNPLFVSELVTAGGTVVPRSIRDAVLARVARVPPETRDLVHLVSVVPGVARWSTIEQVLGSDAAVGPAEQLRVLVDGEDGVTFRHEVQRRAVEGSLPVLDRRRLHARVLDALGDDADPARLAHHARGAGDDEALRRYAPEAARRALAANSHRQAIEHFRSLEPHLDDMPVGAAAALADGWARATWHVDSEAAVDIVVRAASLRRADGDATALARTLAFGAFVLQLGGRADEGGAWAREAVDLVEASGPSSELAYALTEHARFLLADGDQSARAVAERAFEVAEAVGDSRVAASAITILGVLRTAGGDLGGRDLMWEGHLRARRHGHRFEEVDALLMHGALTVNHFDHLEEATRDLRAARELATDHEFFDLAAFAEGCLAVVATWTGDWPTAEDRADRVLTATAPPDARLLAQSATTAIAMRRGLPGADELVDRLLADASALVGPLVNIAGAIVAERTWLSEGDGRDVATLLHDLVASSGAARHAHVQDLVFWSAMAGHLDTVPDHLDAGYRAILDGAGGRAAATWARRGMPYNQAIALLHGSDDEAVDGVRLLEELRADAAATRARALLRDRGITVPRGRARATREHVAGLTPRQAEVLALLATGATNPDIADELFISRRTVENHVAQVLRRLDAADRDEAVERARSEGFLEPDDEAGTAPTPG
jgi:DNA-binding CsgD family transcriptional regulator